MSHNPAMPHGPIEEVFPDVFVVTGTMRNIFFGDMWQFSRNMTMVREDGKLTLFNAVRLGEEGLAALESLGTITNIVQIGSMHGHDDRFYVDTYDATFWSVEGMPQEEGLSVDRYLTIDGELPIGGAELFLFETTKMPEAIVFLQREGRIALACDSLQNWEAPDAFMDASTIEKMTGMGFFARANLGPAWVHGMEPQKADFDRLREIPYEHALCAHGTPIKGNASTTFHATFDRVFAG